MTIGYSSQLYDGLVNELTVEISEAKESLSNGSALSFENYKEQCGYIRGLDTSLRIARDIFKQLNGE